MNQNWTKIRVYNKPIQAEIVKQMLLENNIPAVVLNKQDSSYFFGQVELYVDVEHEAEALALIDSYGEEEDHEN